MSGPQDPRLIATRASALDAALRILEEDGVLAITHASISKATSISRSTLYRHWPDVTGLRNDAFKRAARSARTAPRTNGPLHADLIWLLGFLLAALNDTPWGHIAPQVIAAAASDAEAKSVINGFIRDRKRSVEAIFEAAIARRELSEHIPLDLLVEMTIAVPYFRKLVAGEVLDQDWLDHHVALICRLAEAYGPTPV